MNKTIYVAIVDYGYIDDRTITNLYVGTDIDEARKSIANYEFKTLGGKDAYIQCWEDGECVNEVSVELTKNK